MSPQQLEARDAMHRKRAECRRAWRIYPTFALACELLVVAWEAQVADARWPKRWPSWEHSDFEHRCDEVLMDAEGKIAAAPLHLRDAWVDELIDQCHDLERSAQ